MATDSQGRPAHAAAGFVTDLAHHPDAVYLLDTEGRFVVGNPGLERLTGYCADELVGDTLLSHVHPDDLGTVVGGFEAALAGQARHYQTTCRTKDGRDLDVDVITFPLVRDGRVAGVQGIARDISEQRRVREAIAERERLFGDMLGAAPVGIAMYSLEGRFVAVNPAYCAMVGYDEAHLLGTDFLTVTHPDDRAANVAALDALLAGEVEHLALEKRYSRSSGEAIWAKVNVSVAHSESGEPEHLIAIAVDNSAQRQAEADLRASQLFLRTAAMARVGAWTIELPDRGLTTSPAVNLILGVSPASVITLEVAMTLFSGDDVAALRAAADRAVAEGTGFDLEVPATLEDGRHIWLRLVGEPERDATGRVRRIRGALQDVTARREAATESLRLAERLATTLESITDAFYTVDRDWRFSYVNRRAEEILQRTRDSLLGNDIWEEFPPAVGTELYHAYHRSMRQSETVVLDAFYYEPSGSWYEVSIYPSAQGLAVYFRDIADQVEREQALRRLADAEQAAAERLRHLDQVKNAFLSAVSHELRTPLTVVRGMAATLHRMRGALSDPERWEIEDSLMRHAERLGRLLDDLLDVDRLAAGALGSRPVTFDLASVAEAVIARSLVHDRAVLEISEALEVRADPVQIERILANLLDNAAKYAPDGEIDVSVSGLGGDGFRLVVADRGQGIPEDELERVFEAFHRVNHDHHQPGTGVGLALVAQFVALQGGTAWAENRDGGGARVLVEIPGSVADVAVAER